jgi:hypothetical protein
MAFSVSIKVSMEGQPGMARCEYSGRRAIDKIKGNEARLQKRARKKSLTPRREDAKDDKKMNLELRNSGEFERRASSRRILFLSS